MSSDNPRKPPLPPSKPQPHPQAQPYQSPEEKPASNTGMIIGIVAAVLFVVVGLPILGCLGCVGYGMYRTRQITGDIGDAIVAEQKMQAQAEQQRQQAIVQRLGAKDGPLYPLAKEALDTHLPNPTGARRKNIRDWEAKPMEDNRYELRGFIEYSMKQGPEQTNQWSCEFRTSDNPASPAADWKLEKLIVDGEQKFP